ncbi:MAG: nicotinate-nucleotide adenylyltransferase [Bryobacteraceae bacterium]
MRYAIFGGTFDPIHTAHLEVARQAAARFALDEVLLIPAGNPPHKQGLRREPFEHRYRMVELACLGEAKLRPSRIEQGRERSYSIHTIERLRESRPGDAAFFLIGADAFAEIETWHRWNDVVAAVEFIVVSRPGHRYDIPEGARVHRLDSVELPVSSSEIRNRLAHGENPPQLSASVLAYIREHRLYGVDHAAGNTDATITAR